MKSKLIPIIMYTLLSFWSLFLSKTGGYTVNQMVKLEIVYLLLIALVLTDQIKLRFWYSLILSLIVISINIFIERLKIMGNISYNWYAIVFLAINFTYITILNKFK